MNKNELNKSIEKITKAIKSFEESVYDYLKEHGEVELYDPNMDGNEFNPMPYDLESEHFVSIAKMRAGKNNIEYYGYNELSDSWDWWEYFYPSFYDLSHLVDCIVE